jgi:glutathione S-transferase
MSVEGASVEEAAGTAAEEATVRATLYVIPGSHACRTGMLLLEHKEIPFEVRELPTGAHPWMVRALGFPGNPGPTRDVGGRSYLMVGLMDRLGTVPALRYGDRRIQTNTKMIEFLEALRPDPPLWPADPELAARAREAQRWGNEPLQMLSRRLALIGGVKGGMSEDGGAGRLGALLARGALTRKVVVAAAGRTFKVARAEPELLEQLPGMLDKVDAWVGEGVLGSQKPNAADYTIAPCLALLDYRLDLREELRARPSFELVRRFVPEPAG